MFDYTVAQLEGEMKKTVDRQAMHAHNLANVETPGFKPLRFDEELNKAVERQDRKHVIVEEEMAALSSNSIKYSAYVKLLSQKINVLKTIASQGRR